MTAPVSNIEILDELQLDIIGRRDWLDRARAGKIRRSPEDIERQASRLRVLEAGWVRFKRLSEAAR